MTVRVLLGHGSSGTAESMRAYVEGLRARGCDAAPLSLPRGSAERAIPRLLEQVGPDVGSAVIGGHSFGGRVASMVAAQDPRFRALPRRASRGSRPAVTYAAITASGTAAPR